MCGGFLRRRPDLTLPVRHVSHEVVHFSQCRYAASEGLYNIAKVARSLVLPYMSPIFEVLSRAIADTEEKAQEGAGLLDRLFKDIVSEMDADVSVQPFVELIADRMY